jgi:hypothetical protein
VSASRPWFDDAAGLHAANGTARVLSCQLT